jgi:hypothetical protein
MLCTGAANLNLARSLTTDKDGISVVKTKNDHTCNMESDERKSEAQVLRVRVQKALSFSQH